MPRFALRVTKALEGRFAISAILAFCMFSATFALATVIAPGRAPATPSAIASVGPEGLAAELVVRELVEERIHMHLKRLHSMAPLQ
jgi:hypothetical protein